MRTVGVKGMRGGAPGGKIPGGGNPVAPGGGRPTGRGGGAPMGGGGADIVEAANVAVWLLLLRASVSFWVMRDANEVRPLYANERSQQHLSLIRGGSKVS